MSASPHLVGVLGTSHIHLCDPHEAPTRTRRRQPTTLTPKPNASQRLTSWIRRHAMPPKHILKRPLEMNLPRRVVETNNFPTNVVILDSEGQLHLGNLQGEIIGCVPSA